jgi:hypothetical protein
MPGTASSAAAAGDLLSGDFVGDAWAGTGFNIRFGAPSADIYQKTLSLPLTDGAKMFGFG